MNENMALASVSTVYDDLLVAGSGYPIVTDGMTILAGAGSLVRGTVLGKITIGAATKAAAGAGAAGANTGNGTLTMDATTPIKAGAKVGVYKVKIVKAAVADPAAAAVAHVFDPDGDLIDIIDVATTPGTTYDKQIKFVIVDGSTPFAAGDGFTVTIAAGSGKYKTVNSAAVDGSAVAKAILAVDADASGDSDVVAPVFLTGEFNSAGLTFGGSDTSATHKESLRALGIFIKSAEPA